MSKFSKILVALLASSFIAAPAFAITADFTGFLQTRGIAYDNMNGNDDLDDNARGVDSRFRLWTNTALNENVKAVFAIEVDYTWGSTNGNAVGTGGFAPAGIGKIGADQKGEIEIKQLYLDFNLPSVNTNLKVGTQYSVLGNGYILAGDDFTGLSARYTPAKGHSFLFTWVKSIEGTLTAADRSGLYDDSSDADYYQLQYDVDIAGWRISPLFGYYDLKENDKALFYGASASGKAGPVALAATLIGNDWEVGANDGTGIAALVNAKYSLNATTFSAEYGYAGDKDNDTENYANSGRGAFFSVRAYHQVSEILTGGRFDGRGTVGSNQTATAASTTSAPYEPNWQYVKLGAEHKCNDRTKVSAFYIYAEQAEKGANGDKITYGHEIDAYLDYTIHKGLTFTVGGGYLFADNDFGDNPVTPASEGGDDAWKIGTALTYTF